MADLADLVVGVDAGGTSTRAVACDRAGGVAGRGVGGGANPRSSGAPAHDALTAALAAAVARQDRHRVVGGVVGMAGAGAAGRDLAIETAQRAWRAAGLTGSPLVTDDLVVAFTAGSDAGDGLVLIAGTGAVAGAVSATSVLRRADGYGWMVGDEGSAVWLGFAALRAALAAHDGRGPATILVDALRDALKIGYVEFGQAVVAAVHARPPAAAGRLAPTVITAAEDGDEVAGGLVAEGCDRLMASLAAVAGPSPPRDVVLAGGLLDPMGPVGRRLRSAVGERWPDAAVRGAASGEAGAALLALRRLPDAPDPGTVRRRLLA